MTISHEAHREKVLSKFCVIHPPQSSPKLLLFICSLHRRWYYCSIFVTSDPTFDVKPHQRDPNVEAKNKKKPKRKESFLLSLSSTNTSNDLEPIQSPYSSLFRAIFLHLSSDPPYLLTQFLYESIVKSTYKIIRYNSSIIYIFNVPHAIPLWREKELDVPKAK